MIIKVLILFKDKFSLNRNMIIDDYLNYHNKYVSLYGNKTIILMQVGSFFEIYSLTNEGPDVHEIANILEIRCTRKDKSIEEISRKNYYLVGFPLYIIDKYVDILTMNQYTCVLIEQVTLPPEPKREVTRIISPSTNLNYSIDNSENNFLMCIYFSFGKNKLSSYIISSISFIDMNTNETYICECTNEDSILNIEDTLKTIINNKPSEITFMDERGTKTFPISIGVDKIVNYAKGSKNYKKLGAGISDK
jgi:DNA mismatch repair protein MutS